MPTNSVIAAVAAEAAALCTAVAGLTAADLGRASRCAPWTAGDLACHVIVGARRIGQAAVGPDDPTAALITTVGYYRPDERFSAAVDADRIGAARNLARQLGSADAIRAELARACTEAVALLTQAPADRTIRTRHGDRMLLADFARTRVVELGLHGLDLAIALDRPPWLTGEAAAVLEELLLPAGNAARLRAELGRDRAALIAVLTGRAVPAPAEAAVLASAGSV
ncbi:MAG: maleylpyruvate isomerase N-terminal domain-containing protein, partial [Streptosporangiaceae bacterium]